MADERTHETDCYHWHVPQDTGASTAMTLLDALEPGTEVTLVSEGPHPAPKEIEQDETHDNRAVDREVDAKLHTVPPLGLEPHDVSVRNAASTRDRVQFPTHRIG